MSMDPYARETIESWVGDFCDSTPHAQLPYSVREYAPEVLATLMVAACEHDDVAPGEVTEAGLRAALLESVTQLAVPASVRPGIPELCRVFLAELETHGRLAGGGQLGAYVGALHVAYDQATTTAGRPITNVATKLSRNDPCPCGSGKKYKKCCMGLLDQD